MGILKGLPSSTAAQLQDAISLTCHKEEIEEFIQENEKAYGEYLVEQKSLKVAEDLAIEPRPAS